MKNSILDRYPQYQTLTGLVPDDVVERVLSKCARVYEKYQTPARKAIPTVKLSEIFPSDVEQERIVLENFLGHWGNISVEEVAKIALITKFLKPKKIFEFGTYNGMTTLQMALNARQDCVVYTLDLPEQEVDKVRLGEIDNYVARHFRKKFGTFTGSYFKGRKDINIVQLLCDSQKFDPTPYRSSVDLVFIDAAHDYRHKKNDSEKALAMLRPGGVIIWHNVFDVGCPEVTHYLLDLSNEKKIWHLKNTLLAVYQEKKDYGS